MVYRNITEGRFISRPNRFIAYAEINGTVEKCHVRNTGRCKELLTEGCTVWLDRSDSPARSTKYDLVAVKKGERIINMDSYAPNRAAGEFLPLLFPGGDIRPEYTWGNSRFDFFIVSGTEKILLEVKGVTLEKDGIAMFPDAPTERGVKHLNELIKAASEGYKAYMLFVIQMKGVKYFTPNNETHALFGETLKKAASSGVDILAYDCIVTPDSIKINERTEIRL